MRAGTGILIGAMVATALAGCQKLVVEKTTIDDVKATGAWGEVGDGLRTQLGEIPNSYARGYLKMLYLTMENTGNKAREYDDQQVACNDSLDVRREDGTPVEFRGQIVSTTGEIKKIDPGCIAPLFYGFILEEQYDISQPGVYTVQFRGQEGGSGCAAIRWAGARSSRC